MTTPTDWVRGKLGLTVPQGGGASTPERTHVPTLEPRRGRAHSGSGSTEPETMEAHNVHADCTYRDYQLSPPSPILFPATMRNSRLDVPVTLASPRIGLQARWVSVSDADGTTI